ncbi:RNA-dependent RNA polymerase [Botrytis cinerea negative-stranded RNA virus 4]|uniref:RNA-directed RNA polymerase n=1 Tax=Botrytis cinerea negative-stranded RNA virus 4 TaxID=2735939 RepID=A0AAE7AK07_9MONO|nr:RNA-dependent RNA polymerase [Botrytis cinerea negative-stranded RNA virus 4]QJT73698.1 RNA-dependent RNA polymerase [Botrytis cinerea negative-stranded RNA virus 4]
MDSKFEKEVEPWFVFEDEFDTKNHKPNAPADKHLSSPISPSLIHRLERLFVAVCEYEFRLAKTKPRFPYLTPTYKVSMRRLKNTNNEHSYSGLMRKAEPCFDNFLGASTFPPLVTPQQYPEFLAFCINTTEELTTSIKESKELFDIEMEAFSAWGQNEEVRKLADSQKNSPIKLNKETLMHYQRYRYWDIISETYRIRKSNQTYGKGTHKIAGHTWYYYDGFLIMEEGESTTRLDENGIPRLYAPVRHSMVYEQLQMFQDCCLARFNTFLAIDCSIHNSTAQIHTYVSRIIDWQEKVLLKYGNEGYELVKSPESITKAYMNQLSDGDILPVSSYVRTLGKMMVKEEKLAKKLNILDKSSYHELSNELSRIITSTKDMSIICELFGCTKLSGHPLVYAEASAKSVQEEAVPRGSADPIAIRQYHLHFVQLVLHRYLEKNNHWPAFKEKCAPKEDTQLYRIWKSGVCKIRPTSYKIEDLTDVRFEKFIEFDYSPDYLDMIDDKAISPGGQHAAQFWFSSNSTTYRRLLESLIKRTDVDTFAIVERMRRGKFSLAERIVELTQKEREFKISARCFSKLTFEVRLFFVLTEANLKRFCGGDTGDNGYLPQQTMTMSSTKLKQRLYNLSTRTNTAKTCMIEVDFSRWNLRWKPWTVNPISRTLEDIFGLPGVFSQAHNFFSSATIVLTDKHNKPPGIKEGMPAHKWPTSNLVWRNHTGGFEGIQQTLWTICTIAMMYYALRDEECSFKMAGQGDNQIFHINFLDSKKTLNQSLLQLLFSMDRECGRLNHEVKPEECIDSKTVLTYGKEIYIKGVHKMYSLKFSSRAFARSDYSIPSLSKEIAGLVSNSIAVAGTLYQPIRAILWKHLQVLLFLHRRSKSNFFKEECRSINRLLKTRTSRKALLIPGSLGGLPMMPWTRYFSKGETDDLSFDVAASYYIAKSEPIIQNYLSLLLHKEFTSTEIDVSNLINDPHSIPIDRPNDSSHLIAEAISQVLPNVVVNKDIKQLINPNHRHTADRYKKLLSKIRPVYPQILHDLFELTPSGLTDKMIKRFSMTRTLEKFVDMRSFTNIVSRSGALLVNTIIDRLAKAGKKELSAIPTPYDMCTVLRDHWNIDLKHSSIGIYTPFDFQMITTHSKNPKIEVSVPVHSEISTTVGTSPPNFGTTTRQKISDHGYRIVNTNSTIAALKRTTLMFSELQGSDSVKPFFNSIVTSRSPWTLDSLVPVFPTQYGGASVHRHQSATNHFAMLGSNTIATHCILNTDDSGILSGGELDYPVVFQTMFMTAMNLLQNFHSAGQTNVDRISFLIPSKLDPIDVSICEYKDGIDLPKWPNLVGNKLAWTNNLLASEIPVIPRAEFIEHIESTNDDISLLYSYFEFNPPDRDLEANPWDGILTPFDFLDLKECSRINGYDAEKALSWLLLTDVMEAYVKSPGDQIGSQQVNAYISKRSRYIAGLWVRVRLHPMFLTTKYNKVRRITLQPTEQGYKKPVEYLAHIMRMSIVAHLDTKNFHSVPSLILFNNWKTKARRVSERRILLAAGMASYQRGTKENIRSFLQRTIPPNELLNTDPSAYLSVISKPFSKNIRSFPYELPVLKTQFINKSSEESLRSLRSRELKTDTPNFEIISNNVKFSNHGICTYKLEDCTGNVQPDERTEAFRLNPYDRFRVLRRRTIGTMSPLYSDWNAIITQYTKKNLIRRTDIAYVIGIGRGAICRSLVEKDIHVVGYDMRKTFPTLSHRSASYVPPEISNTPRRSLFSWSNHTMSTPGDCTIGDLQIPAFSSTVVFLDIDQNIESVLKVIEKIPFGTRLCVRYRGTEQEINYLVSIIQPEVINCLLMINDEVRDVVMFTNNSGPVSVGNAIQVIWLKKNELQYKNTDTELSNQLWFTSTKIASHLDARIDERHDVLKEKIIQLAFTNERDLEFPLDRMVRQVYLSDITSLDSNTLRLKAILSNIVSE